MTVGGDLPEDATMRRAHDPDDPDNLDQSPPNPGSLGRDAHAELLSRRGPLRPILHALGLVEEAEMTMLRVVAPPHVHRYCS